MNKISKQALIERSRAEVDRLLQVGRDMAEKLPKHGEVQLDRWQKQALECLQAGKNLVIDAPTTAGKTRVVEQFFAANVHRTGFRACYTCPVKSLSNDKVIEFRQLFGADAVGIATGDFKENLQAPIVVSTLETYRNSLLGLEPDLGRELVIFDEYHFINDLSRGSAWEEAMILTPKTCQIAMMSASVANPEEFVEWLRDLTQRSTELVQVEKRPVPLCDLVWWRGSWILADQLPKDLRKPRKKVPAESLSINYQGIAERAARLLDWDLTPCILYVGRRRSCAGLASLLADIAPPLPARQSEAILASLQSLGEGYEVLSNLDEELRRLLVDYGIAYHHSGHAPAVRLGIEKLVKEGLLRFCCATMGLSLGINFSVRSTLICDTERPGERGPTRYCPSEVLQMTGRAGRRGRDAVGFCLWPSLTFYHLLGQPKREAGESQLRVQPSTLLSLVAQGYPYAMIRDFYSQSFLGYRHDAIDFTLITRDLVEDQLGRGIPCESPAGEYAHWKGALRSACQRCHKRKRCHRWLTRLMKRRLPALQLHLYQLGALRDEVFLTHYGELAKHFPQGGGLLIAYEIAHGRFTDRSLLRYSQLIAALSTARYKKLRAPDSYRFPFRVREVEAHLEDFYPYHLFSELFDPPYGHRSRPIYRDFNPKAGFIIYEWANGCSWEELMVQTTNEFFGPGDVTSVIYRVASFLQSMSSVPDQRLAESARLLRDSLIREPILVDPLAER